MESRRLPASLGVYWKVRVKIFDKGVAEINPIRRRATRTAFICI